MTFLNKFKDCKKLLIWKEILIINYGKSNVEINDIKQHYVQIFTETVKIINIKLFVVGGWSANEEDIYIYIYIHIHTHTHKYLF
jgi:hypothetical protein